MTGPIPQPLSGMGDQDLDRALAPGSLLRTYECTWHTFDNERETLSELHRPAATSVTSVSVPQNGAGFLMVLLYYFPRRKSAFSFTANRITVVGTLPSTSFTWRWYSSLALIAVARHIIAVAYHHAEPLQLFGLAALVLALAAGYFLLRRVQDAPTERAASQDGESR